jgi:hypothetical protein
VPIDELAGYSTCDQALDALRQAGDSGAHQIARPGLQLLQTLLSAGEAFGTPFGLRLGIAGCRFGASSLLGFIGRFGGAGGTAGEPFFDPGRPRAMADRLGRGDINQQQAQAMLAGKLAAGAGALKGGLVQIDLHLIGLGTAALALAPQDCLIGGEQVPLARLCQRLPAFGGAGIGRQLQHALLRQRNGHSIRPRAPSVGGCPANRFFQDARTKGVVRVRSAATTRQLVKRRRQARASIAPK